MATDKSQENDLKRHMVLNPIGYYLATVRWRVAEEAFFFGNLLVVTPPFSLLSSLMKQ